MSFIKSCGLMLEPQLGMSPAGVVEWAQYAEKTGFGYVFRSDHVLHTSGRRGTSTPECWVTLGMIAASTKQIKFGPLVSPVGFRNPALLAKMACTVHSFSGGRLMLGLGAGWFESEYLAHGYEFPRFRARKDQLEEALKIIRPLTEGRPADFKGTYFSAKTEPYPKPKERILLVLGGRNQKIVEAGAPYADEWNVFSSPIDKFLALKELVVSRAPRRVTMSLMIYAILAENRRELVERVRYYARSVKLSGGEERLLRQIRAKGVICGNIEEFVAEVNKRRDAGVEKFYFQVLNIGDRRMFDLLAQTLKTEF